MHPELEGDNRHGFMLVIGLYLVVLMLLLRWVIDTIGLDVPRFLVLWVQFYVVKLAGDVVYYHLRPQYRDFATAWEYSCGDVLDMTRFAFPLAVIQRTAESYARGMWGAPGALLVHILTGPYLAILVYLSNRLLRERAADRSFRAGARLRRLP